MKNLVVISLFLLISSMIFSCKKSNQQPQAANIVGNWKLLSDSGYIASGTTKQGVSNYIGSSSDYYNFKNGGNLSWHENNMSSDSGSYSMKPADTVVIAYLPESNPNYSQNVVEAYTIMELSANKLVINLVGYPMVDGIPHDKITFSR